MAALDHIASGDPQLSRLGQHQSLSARPSRSSRAIARPARNLRTRGHHRRFRFAQPLSRWRSIFRKSRHRDRPPSRGPGDTTYESLARKGAAMTTPPWWRTPTTKSTRPERHSNNYREPMQTLRVGAAYPDPPFNGMPDDGGLDIDLMTAIAEKLGMGVEFVPYEGADFNGIFDALERRRVRLRRRRHHRHSGAGEEGGVRPAVPDLGPVAGRRHPPAARRRFGRRSRRSDHRRAAGQHQRADRRASSSPTARRPASGSTTTETSAPRSTT